MNIITLRVGTCILLFLLPLSACSGSTFPYGTYTADSGSIDTIVLNADGSFTFTGYGIEISSGTFSIRGNELTWDTDAFCDERDGGKATYHWTLDGDDLRFQLQGEDGCTGRVNSLHSGAFHLEK